MRDRLGEIQGEKSVVASAALSDLEAGDGASKGMAGFFEEVANIRSTVANIKKLVQDVNESHAKALVSVSEEQGKDQSSEVEAIMNQINSMSAFVRKKLKDMDTLNKAFDKKNPGSSDSRIRATQVHSN